MIKQIKSSIIYNDDQKECIKALKNVNGSLWNKRYNEITLLKESIREQLTRLQNYECAYCGFKLGVTSNDEIEHIAPKGTLRDGTILYPEFMFTEKNLVLACHLCNSIMRKGVFDTIESYHHDYKKCTFKIVHPYFDKPDEHYVLYKEGKRVILRAKNNSLKALTSIKIFKLDDIQHSEQRAKDIMFEEYMNEEGETYMDEIIRNVMNFK